jgi:hypothetical protein
MYKTQFEGAEFFNGVKWSDDLDELKYLIKREDKEVKHHLLETEEYRELFYDGKMSEIVAGSEFRLRMRR